MKYYFYDDNQTRRPTFEQQGVAFTKSCSFIPDEFDTTQASAIFLHFGGNRDYDHKNFAELSGGNTGAIDFILMLINAINKPQTQTIYVFLYSGAHISDVGNTLKKLNQHIKDKDEKTVVFGNNKRFQSFEKLTIFDPCWGVDNASRFPNLKQIIKELDKSEPDKERISRLLNSGSNTEYQLLKSKLNHDLLGNQLNTLFNACVNLIVHDSLARLPEKSAALENLLKQISDTWDSLETEMEKHGKTTQPTITLLVPTYIAQLQELVQALASTSSKQVIATKVSNAVTRCNELCCQLSQVQFVDTANKP